MSLGKDSKTSQKASIDYTHKSNTNIMNLKTQPRQHQPGQTMALSMWSPQGLNLKQQVSYLISPWRNCRFCMTPIFPVSDVNFASFRNVLGLIQKFIKCQLENFNWLISNISSLNDLLVLFITYHLLLLPSGWQLLIYSFLVDDIICPWMELTKALHI